MNTKEKQGQCEVCGKETIYYCKSCSENDEPTWFCEEHYKSVVLTGNCCSGSEKLYSKRINNL